MHKIIFICLFSCAALQGMAQLKTDVRTWLSIEDSIAKKSRLRQTWRRIDSIQQLAVKTGDEAATARCLWLKLKIKDAVTEDTLFLKNAFVIDSALQHTPGKNGKLALALHLMKGERLYTYMGKFINSFYAYRRPLIKEPPGGIDFAGMDKQSLQHLIDAHYESALRIAGNLGAADMTDMLWLTTRPLAFLIKPTPADIVFAEWIYNDTRPAGYLRLQSWPLRWHQMPPGDIIGLADSAVNKLPAEQEHQMRLWLRWMRHHQHNTGAAYFVEALCRNNYYPEYTVQKEVEAAYEQYLLAAEKLPLQAVKALAVYHLCEMWNKRAGNYNSKVYRSSYYQSPFFDTAARPYYVKWRQLFEKHSAMLDSFGILKNNLILKKQMSELQEYAPRMEQFQMPGREVPLMLHYRNAPRLTIRVVRLYQHEKIPVRDSVAALWLFGKTAVQETVIETPVHNDYQKHNMFYTLKPLPAGRYVLQIFAGTPYDNSRPVSHSEFAVTRTAVLMHENRACVLDRVTGAPLYSCQIQKGITIQNKKNSRLIWQPAAAMQAQPFVAVMNRVTGLRVMHGADTTEHFFSKREPVYSDEIFNPEDHEDLEDYFDQETSIYMYTSRAACRPGQTVHYKGIFIGRHPYTGTPMIMNRENLQKDFPGMYKKWVQQKTVLYIKDPFDKRHDTLKVQPNDYGSFSGTFRIPKNAATGQWNFYGPDVSIASGGNRTFRVEEYKRPSYAITLEKPDNNPLPGDSFYVQIKARSFSGAALGRVLVKYRLTREKYYLGQYDYSGRNDTLLTGQGYTDNKGMLRLLVTDTARYYLAGMDSLYKSAQYELVAEAVDAGGESHKETLNFELNNRPVNIQIQAPAVAEKGGFSKIPVFAADDKGRILNKAIKVILYKKNDAQYHNTSWPEADVWLLDKETFSRTYPALTGDIPAGMGRTREKMYETELKTGVLSAVAIPAVYLEPGLYTLEAVCRENGAITGLAAHEFSVYDLENNRAPADGRFFSHIATSQVHPGDTLTWLNSGVKDGVYNIYHARYYVKEGGRLVIKNLYDLQPPAPGIRQWRWVIPANLSSDIKLNRLYIYENEVTEDEETIYLAPSHDKEPELVVEQYRKRVAPGAKEIFTVSLKTNNEKRAAELLTTMYDASLDKLFEHDWNTAPDAPDLELDNNWRTTINRTINEYDFSYGGIWRLPGHPSGGVQPLWWLNPLDYAFGDPAYKRGSGDYSYENQLRLDYTGGMYGLTGQAKFDAGSGKGFDFNGFAFRANRLIANQTSVRYSRAFNFGTDSYLGRVNYRRAYVGDLDADVMGDWNSIPIRIGNLPVPGAGNLFGIKTTAVPFLRISPEARSQSLSIYKSYLIVLDGEIYRLGLDKIDAATITDMVTLNGADAAALFGPDAAKGLLLLSTKGLIPLPEALPPPPVARKNFNETAFFFPAIYADTAGYYHIEFTLPESVTEWKWKMLAHDKQARFTYLEKTIVSQLPLMVQPNMPRVLYQGDRIVLKSRITSLDSSAMNGRIAIAVEDVVTGEDLTAKVCSRREWPFALSGMENMVKGMPLTVPPGLLNPLKIKVTVQTQGFADAEEHIIPVLTKQVLVSKPVLYNLPAGGTTTVTAPVAGNGIAPYGAGLYIQPQPGAALLQALPRLAAYPYGCAEQTFNKMLAHVLAVYAMRNDAELRRQYKTWAGAELPELPVQPHEELMPWLQLNQAQAAGQRRLANLLDTLKSRENINDLFDELGKLQLPGGGISWFKNGQADPYISAYLLAAMGRLEQAGISLRSFSNIKSDCTQLLENLVQWNDKYLEGRVRKNHTTDIFAWYARSFWTAEWPLPKLLRDSAAAVFTRAWSNRDKIDQYEMPMLIMATLRLKTWLPQLQDAARQEVQSIKESAISDGNGIRWKHISGADITSHSNEEQLALLAEMFLQAGNETGMVKGILKWILMNRNDYEWGSTKAVAAMLQLLYRFKDDKIPAATVTAGDILKVNNNILNGQLSDFKGMTAWPGQTVLAGTNGPSGGVLNYYYFTDYDKMEAGPVNGLTLEKTMQVFNDSLNTWQPVLPGTVLHNGQQLRISLRVTTPKKLQYVMIEDKRAACLEPADLESGYKHSGIMSYYQSVRDAGYYFFVDVIAAGTHSIQYETVVSQEGTFTSGPAMLQCMYNPAVRGYSGSGEMRVE